MYRVAYVILLKRSCTDRDKSPTGVGVVKQAEETATGVAELERINNSATVVAEIAA